MIAAARTIQRHARGAAARRARAAAAAAATAIQARWRGARARAALAARQAAAVRLQAATRGRAARVTFVRMRCGCWAARRPRGGCLGCRRLELTARCPT